MDKSFGQQNAETACRRRRLVAGSLAAVDICTCGCMELKLGNISLRLSPDAMGELVGTLAEAIARYNTTVAATQMGPAMAWPGASRGQA